MTSKKSPPTRAALYCAARSTVASLGKGKGLGFRNSFGCAAAWNGNFIAEVGGEKLRYHKFFAAALRKDPYNSAKNLSTIGLFQVRGEFLLELRIAGVNGTAHGGFRGLTFTDPL